MVATPQQCTFDTVQTGKLDESFPQVEISHHPLN
jgi:hypothetical protein